MNQDHNTPWQYKPDGDKAIEESAGQDDSDSAAAEPVSTKSVSWEAAEFIEQHHPPAWYAGLVIITAALAALVYLVAKDYFATGIIVIVGIIVGIFANQKPGRAKYEIDESGISVNGKLYKYSNYKSFALIQEGDLSSVNLFPLKRLMPPLSAYFDPKDEAKITDVLGNYLPYEDRKLDSIERLSRRLRL